MHRIFSVVKIIMLQNCTLHLHNLSIFHPIKGELGCFLRSSFLAKTTDNLIITLMGFNLITPQCSSFPTLLLSLNLEQLECYRLNTNSSSSKNIKVCARSATATDFLMSLFSLLT